MEENVNTEAKAKKNIFIVTLGTREIQFKRDELNYSENFELANDYKKVNIRNLNDSEILLYENPAYPEFLCCSWPRLAGDIILKHYDFYKNVIHFPLIENSLISISGKYNINEVIIVYTDQHDLNLEENKSFDNFKRDTLFYKEILEKALYKKFFRDKTIEISGIVVAEKVTDIDFQYNYFATKCQSLFSEKELIDQIFLLPQGGIDQINHSLTLQLIQAFGDKVKLWQQAESAESRQLEFANLFLKDLIKRQIVSLINNADYNGALTLAEQLPSFKNEVYQTSLQNLKLLLEFGKLRMDFLVEEIGRIGRKAFTGMNVPGIIKDYKCKESLCSKSFTQCFGNSKYFSAFMTSERYFLARFYYEKRDYSRFILSLAIFIETFCNHFISANSKYCILDSSGYKNNGKKLIAENPDWMKICLVDLAFSPPILSLTLPINITICKIIADSDSHDIAKQLISIFKKLNYSFKEDCIFPIDSKRNDIAHRGEGVTEEEIRKFKENNIIEKLDEIIGFPEVNPVTQMNDFITEYIQTNL